jgi:hypothetical protein
MRAIPGRRRRDSGLLTTALALSSLITACSQPADSKATNSHTLDSGFVIREIDEGLFAGRAEDDKFVAGSDVLWLKRQGIVTGDMVASATNNYDVSTPPWEQRYVSVTLTPEGQQRLESFGDSHPGVRVAMLLNGRVIATAKAAHVALNGNFLLGPLADTSAVLRVMREIRRGASVSSHRS